MTRDDLAGDYHEPAITARQVLRWLLAQPRGELAIVAHELVALAEADNAARAVADALAFLAERVRHPPTHTGWLTRAMDAFQASGLSLAELTEQLNTEAVLPRRRWNPPEVWLFLRGATWWEGLANACAARFDLPLPERRDVVRDTAGGGYWDLSLEWPDVEARSQEPTLKVFARGRQGDSTTLLELTPDEADVFARFLGRCVARARAGDPYADWPPLDHPSSRPSDAAPPSSPPCPTDDGERRGEST